MDLLLTPESVRVVALVVLNGALTAYLLRVPRGPGAARWLAAFTAGMAGLYLCRAAEASLVPVANGLFWGIKTVEVTVVLAALGALVQFAYRFLETPYPREARAALVGAALAVVGGLALALAVRGADDPRDMLMSTYSVAWLAAEAWVVAVLLRKRKRAQAAADTRSARAFAAFAAVSLADALVLVAILGLFASGAPPEVSNVVWVFGILPAIFGVHYARVAVYIGHAPEPTSLRAKLVGLALALVLALIGMTAVLSGVAANPNLDGGIPPDLAMREGMHEAMLPLLVLMLVATVFALVAFPLALRESLVRPVDRLLDGVRRVNAGERDVDLPLRVHDEIGRLTEGFNAMTASLHAAEAELRAYAADLERRVEERTEELAASKAEVEAQARQLEELDRLKTRLFANLSHEFRTPLTLLLGPIEDALKIPDAGARSLAGQLPAMRQSARRLLDLVNQLLDLAKLDAGAFELECETADLVALARNVAATFAGQADRKGVGFLFDAGTATLQADVDEGQVETVLSNLVANALAFTERGGKVRVGVGAEDGHAILTVEDTGAGIAADALPHVFDRFRQADGSATRTHGGTGIGLALAKEITELHGGTIGVESAEGFGTRFTVRLPAGDVTSAPATEPFVEQLAVPTPEPVEAEGAAPEAGADDRPLVLVVEDHDGLRAFIRSHLAGPYRVVEAADGAAGLAAARAERPDLVLSDVMMPELDGVGLTRALRADAALSDVPIVLLSAWADEASTLAGLEAGADDYLTKPFSPDELLARLANFVAARRRLRERYSDEVVVGPSSVVVPSAEAAFLARVRDAAEAGLSDSGFGVDALAAEVGLSRRQLGRRLRAALDTSPGAFLRQMRLARAAQLLEQAAGTVAEVAYAVGYRDPDHFAKQFRRSYGTPPSAYAEAERVG
jgi:signal transduction histidine kinase/DNA-binding response OmpR family regulator